MFEKTVAAMVREIRENEECISEQFRAIKEELASVTPRVKLNAILKLGYLSMEGYDLSIANFAIIEMMSSSQFLLKRPAMFVATLAFRNDCNNMSLLTANIFQKDLCSSNHLEVGVALSCLASIVTEDIADATIDKVLQLVSFSKPYIRKKVALAIFKLVEVSPKNFATALPKLEALLSDADQSVQTSAVNSLLEISRRNAKLVLPLVPSLFYLLKESKNNWMKIKLMKIFQNLVAIETRISAKLVPLIAELLESNKAKSVEMELVRFVLLNSDDPTIVFDKLLASIESSDLNVQFLGISLVGEFSKKNSRHPIFQEKVLAILIQLLAETDDFTIRETVLSAVSLLVTSPEVAFKTIQHLLTLFAKQEVHSESAALLLECVLGIADQSEISDSSWYLKILVLLSSTGKTEKFQTQIYKQFKRYSNRDPENALTVALSSISSSKVLSPTIVAACVSTIGRWADSYFEQLPEGVEKLVGKVIKTTKMNEFLIVEVFQSYLTLLAALVLHGCKHIDSKDVFDKGTSFTVMQLSTMAATIVDWMTTADPKQIREIFFENANKNPIAVPRDMDKVFIELPKSMKSEYF